MEQKIQTAREVSENVDFLHTLQNVLRPVASRVGRVGRVSYKFV